MSNERLRAALLRKGITPAQLAQQLQIDVKTAERWINGRVPYRKNRYTVATLLGVDESYLWPDALNRDQVVAASQSEVGFTARISRPRSSPTSSLRDR